MYVWHKHVYVWHKHVYVSLLKHKCLNVKRVSVSCFYSEGFVKWAGMWRGVKNISERSSIPNAQISYLNERVNYMDIKLFSRRTTCVQMKKMCPKQSNAIRDTFTEFVSKHIGGI